MRKNCIEITCRVSGSDANIFRNVINQGIDSYLEGFTKSEFSEKDGRYIFNFHRTELHILIRRLEEIGTEQSMLWAEDIKDIKKRGKK